LISANQPLSLSPESTSGLSSTQSGIFIINQSSDSVSLLPNTINGVFNLNTNPISELTPTFDINTIASLVLEPADANLGEGRLGSERVGDTLEGFASGATTTFGISAIFSIDSASASQSTILQDLTRVLPITQASTSASTAAFETVRLRILDFESESITEFDWVLSEDSYEELYGETLGSAEKQLIIFGSAQID